VDTHVCSSVETKTRLDASLGCIGSAAPQWVFDAAGQFPGPPAGDAKLEREASMRVAAIYDIHGNLPALEAVLQDIREANVDQVVVGGDVVPGPLTKETLMRLLDLRVPTHFIYGNCEVAVLEQMAGREPSAVPEQYRPPIRWTARHLVEYQPLLAAWPKTVRLAIPGLGDVLFCHGTPRDENEIFTRLTSEDRLLPLFKELDATVVVCGHTHMQFDRMIGRTRVVNAGSVGMPFGEPGADWLLLGPGVGLRHTSYDLTRAADRLRESDYPDAADFVARYLFQPPTEAAMLAAWAPHELKHAG
jgi:putative phosphoesterase